MLFDLPKHTFYALMVSTLGTGMVYLDQSAVNVALPALMESMDLEVVDLQWVMSIYILFASTPILICGILGDRYGRLRFYITGMILFGLASLGCGLASTLPSLLITRAIQGLGASMMVGVGLAILNANTPRDIRGRVIGLWAGLTSIIIAIGPAIGGLLVDSVSWRIVFVINVPLALWAIAIAWRKLPESPLSGAGDKTDYVSVVLLLLGIGGCVFSLIEQPRLGWSWPVSGVTGFGLLMLLVFLIRQKLVPAALIPLELFRHRVFAMINLITLIQWIAIGSVFFFLPINLQQVQHFSATESGLAVLPITLGIIFVSRVSGKLADRWGARPLILMGIVVITGALWAFAHVGLVENYVRDLLPATALFGLGLGILIAPLTHVAMNALPDQHSGFASGVNNSAARMAHMIAIAIMGSLMVSHFVSNLGTRIKALFLEQNLETEIMAQARNLGAIALPDHLPGHLAATLEHTIATAFVDAWHQTLMIGVWVCVVSFLCAVLWLKVPDPKTD